MASSAVMSAGVWNPKVTALVPCYNASDFLRRTLECLAAQTWSNIEILIGDDCSTDGTVAIIREFAARHSAARVIEQPANLGWLGHSNLLMSKADGELMFFAFHDDIVAPTYVERLVEALRDRPDAVLAFSDMEEFDVNGQEMAITFRRIAAADTLRKRARAMISRHYGWWAPNRGVFRSNAFNRIGGIKPNARGEYAADWNWLLHMALLGAFVCVPEVLCWKYYKPGSLSKRWVHDSGQVSAVRWAGISEVWNSQIGLLDKLILIGAIVRTLLRARIKRGLRWFGSASNRNSAIGK